MGKIVYYDLETTGLNPRNKHKGVEIISIGAVSRKGERFLNFINPECSITAGATRINGFSHNHYGDLVDRDGDVVESAKDPQEGLEDFLDWLQTVGCRYLVSQLFSKIQITTLL